MIFFIHNIASVTVKINSGREIRTGNRPAFDDYETALQQYICGDALYAVGAGVVAAAEIFAKNLEYFAKKVFGKIFSVEVVSGIIPEHFQVIFRSICRCPADQFLSESQRTSKRIALPRFRGKFHLSFPVWFCR